MGNIKIADSDYQIIFNANYIRYAGNESEEISINIVKKQYVSNVIYEIDEQGAFSYNINSIDYYIMDNLGKRRIVWQNGQFECYISGDFTEKEALKMIDSIYKE